MFIHVPHSRTFKWLFKQLTELALKAFSPPQGKTTTDALLGEPHFRYSRACFRHGAAQAHPCSQKPCTAQLPSSTMRPERALKGNLMPFSGRKNPHMWPREQGTGAVRFRDDQAWKNREGGGGQGLGAPYLGGVGRFEAIFRNLERSSLSSAGFQIRRSAQAENLLNGEGRGPNLGSLPEVAVPPSYGQGKRANALEFIYTKI